jgi:hypothetical protein
LQSVILFARAWQKYPFEGRTVKFCKTALPDLQFGRMEARICNPLTASAYGKLQIRWLISSGLQIPNSASAWFHSAGAGLSLLPARKNVKRITYNVLPNSPLTTHNLPLRS